MNTALHASISGRPSRFQVLGERSSGTNYVSTLIKRNLPLTKSEELGWKHGFLHAPALSPALLVVGVVRNPISWVLSMYAKPWHTSASMQSMPFSEFIRSKWDSRLDRADYFGLEPTDPRLGQPLWPDRNPLTGEMFEDVFALRSAKVSGLFAMTQVAPNMVITRFEDVLGHEETWLAGLLKACHLDPTGEFRGINRRLGSRFKAKVSERPQIPKQISDEDRRFMLDRLDLEQESRLGYEFPAV